MSIEFGPKLKQGLADLIGGELVDYQSKIKLTRGRDLLNIQFTEFPEGERRLGVGFLCHLDRAGSHSENAGARPHLDGQPVLKIRRKNTSDLKGKRWGLTREVQTGDSEFDKYIFVDTDAPDNHLKTMLGSGETRRISLSLFKHHCDSINIIRAETATAVTYPLPQHDAASLPQLAEEVKWLIKEALALKASLPVFVGDKKAKQRFGLVSWAYRFLGITILSAIVSGIATSMLNWLPVDEHVIFLLIGIAFGIAVAFVPLSFLIARGHSRGVRHFVWLTILGFIVFPFSLPSLGVGTNAFFDMAPPEQHYVDVVGKGDCSKNRWSIRFRDWRDSTKAFWKTPLTARTCQITSIGDYYLMTTKKGFWGWAWVKKWQKTQ